MARSIHGKDGVLRYILRADPVGQAKLLGLVALGVVLGLLPLHLFRLILDRAIPGRDERLMWQLGGALGGMALLRVFSDYRQALLAERLRNAVTLKLREELLAHVLRLGPDYFARNSVGHIASRIQLEVARLGMSVAAIFVEPIVETTTFAVYAAYLFALDPVLTLLAVCPLPLVALAAPRIGKALTAASKRFGVRTGEFGAALQESLSAAFEVQVHGTYAFERGRVGLRQDRQAELWFEMTRQQARLSSLAQLVRGVGPVIVYMYGAALAMRGEMEVGAIVAFAGVLGGLYTSLEKLIKVPPLWRTAQDRFDELSACLELPRLFVDGRGVGALPEGGARVELRDVCFAYAGGRPVLDGVSLVVEPGERVAFVGRSGCGKSTALGVLCGRLRPAGGEVLVDGSRVGDFTVAELTGAIGVVGQVPLAFSGTVRENLLYALLRRQDGDREAPLSFVEAERIGGDPALFDDVLLEVCARVALDEDLFDLGLEMRLAPDAAAELLALRRAMAASVAGEAAVERFEPGRYLACADVAENLLFAPDDDGEASDAELALWARGAAGAGVADVVAALGLEQVEGNLDYLRSVAADSADLLHSLGTDAEDVARRTRLADSCRARSVSRASLGDAVFDELVRRGLLARDVPERHHAAIVGARTSMRRALGDEAPPVYELDAWHPRLGLRENLLFGRVDPGDRSAAKRVRALLRRELERAGLSDFVRAHALGFDVGERGARLSGGQRQKLSLARVLLKSPRVLLLDEVTASLDQVSARQVYDLFAERDPGCTVIAVTHQVGWLDCFDRIVVFDGGRVVAQGRKAELLAEAGLFRELEHAGARP